MLCPRCLTNKTIAMDCEEDNDIRIVEHWRCRQCPKENEFRVIMEIQKKEIKIIPIVGDYTTL